MTDYSDLKLAVEMISGGKNTVLLDKFGLPSVVVPIAKMTYKDVGVGDETVLPAFVIEGAEKPYFCIGKYQDSLINGVPYSLPMRDPAASVNFDTALKQSRSKGDGWTLTTNAMYAAIALWCRKAGFMPRGNNNLGRDYANTWEKGIPASYDGQKRICRTLTGSGPVSWNHNNDITGICDLNGNVWEWCAGLRQMDGEINIIPDNNAALATADHSAGSSLWKAIQADGSLDEPKTAGSIKIDWAGNKLTFTTGDLTGQSETARSTQFNALAAGEGLEKVPQLLYGLGLFPKDLNGDYGGDNLLAVNQGERLPFRGGSVYDSSSSGVFKMNLHYLRTNLGINIGRRSSYVGTLP